MNYRILIILFFLPFLFSCDETQDVFNDITDPGSSRYVAVGDSLTAGVQSDGIEDDFQFNSFPYLISLQLGIDDFEQPTVGSPGIGFEPGKTPLMFENGMITRDDLDLDPTILFDNFFLDRPYDNLGIPGAQIVDVESTSELLFESILRGMGTQLEQAISLDPELITLWIGNNDVLGAATNGGDINRITPVDEFENDFGDILEQLTGMTDADIVAANIPNVTDIPFVNFLDSTFRTVPQLGINEAVPVIFDQNFEPVDFGNSLYIPLITDETGVENLLISILEDYRDDGTGIPDQQALVNMGFSMQETMNIVSAIEMEGLIASGTAIGGEFTLNTNERNTIQDAVNNFNNSISSVASGFGVPVVDINSTLNELNNFGIDGFTGNFVLEDPSNTAFSLDGVHANNAGYAIIANRFIQKFNEEYGMNIPLINTADFGGQYVN